MATKLPPLILHPFSDASGPGKLMDATRASLALQGSEGRSAVLDAGKLERRLLDGRYCELTMLYYLGKDLLRWIEQCVESVERVFDLSEAGIRPESFAALLVEDAPAQVERKLFSWGVHEYKAIFARSIGLHALFAVLPPRDVLAPEFLRYYHRFADYTFTCRQQLFPFKRLAGAEFEFDLFASGEYSKMLEQQWGTA